MLHDNGGSLFFGGTAIERLAGVEKNE